MANQNADAVLSQFTQSVEREEIDASKKLRVGVIGTGGIAHAHMTSYLKMPDVELVAAAEIIPGRAEAFFEGFGVKGVHIYADYREMLDKEDIVGRKLDFLVQELNREANTMGSKAQDIRITRLVVDIKSEIEKIREQIQNIE